MQFAAHCSGLYRAVRSEEDGTYTIFGVPVFSEVPKGAHPAMPLAVTVKWLQSAIDTARMRETRGYKYRLHLEHHGDKPTSPAGFFRLSHVESLDVEGETIATVYADFYQVPQETFDRIMRGEYPYRSVEIVKPGGDPEINTLALLSTHAPFHKYAALDRDSISVEMTVDELREAFDAPGVVGSFTSADGCAVALFHDISQSEGSMKELKGSLSTVNGALVLNSSGSSATFGLSKTGDPKQGQFSIHTPEGVWSIDGAKFEEGSDEMDKMRAKLKAMEKENHELKAKLKAMDKDDHAKMMEKDDDDADMTHEDDEKSKAKAKAKAAAKAADDTSESAKFAALESALDEVKRERAQEKADKKSTEDSEARFAAAKKSLKGWNISEKTAKSIAKFAEIGQEELDQFLEVYKANVPKDGLSTLDEVVRMGAGTTTEDANGVAAFLAEHPEMSSEVEGVVATYAASPNLFKRPDNTMIPLSDVIERECGGVTSG